MAFVLPMCFIHLYIIRADSMDSCSFLFQHLLDFLHHRFHAIPADDGFDELAFAVVDEVVWDGIVVIQKPR